MAGITLEIAQGRLEDWLRADAALSGTSTKAGSQSYRIDTADGMRELTRADAAEIRSNIDYWQGWVTKLSRASSGIGRTRYIVPG